MAVFELPWFAEWFRGMMAEELDRLHCGQTCGPAGAEPFMVGVTDQGGGKLLTLSVCEPCYRRAPTFEAAGPAADAAEAALLTDCRPFTHAVEAPEGV